MAEFGELGGEYSDLRLRFIFGSKSLGSGEEKPDGGSKLALGSRYCNFWRSSHTCKLKVYQVFIVNGGEAIINFIGAASTTQIIISCVNSSPGRGIGRLRLVGVTVQDVSYSDCRVIQLLMDFEIRLDLDLHHLLIGLYKKFTISI